MNIPSHSHDLFPMEADRVGHTPALQIIQLIAKGNRTCAYFQDLSLECFGEDEFGTIHTSPYRVRE